jgi:hypothetical protein
MSTSLIAVQTGIYTTLSADVTLQTLLSGGSGIGDAVPKDPVFPFIVIGDAIEVPNRHMRQAGHEVLFEVTIYTSDGSTNTNVRGGTVGFRQGLTLMARVHALLVGDVAGVRTLTVTGFNLVDVDVDFSQTAREPDGLMRTIDTRYRLMLETPIA